MGPGKMSVFHQYSTLWNTYCFDFSRATTNGSWKVHLMVLH
jgi:hypothetical protein